jgi:DNA polymerase V
MQETRNRKQAAMNTTQKQPIFALVDCNNFFVSCEKLFRPDLEGKPVVVLSSNDGCVVSRSNEAKALGIPMGIPAFKIRHLIEPRSSHLSAGLGASEKRGPQAERIRLGVQKRTAPYLKYGKGASQFATTPSAKSASRLGGFADKSAGTVREGVVQFSGNFALYGDISRRITAALTSVTPRIEVYSVDESFLDLSELEIPDHTAWGKEVRTLIMRYVGVPVSVGIASTKTLAKLASDRAKKQPELGGVLSISVKGPTFHKHLRATPVEAVWGIGRRMGPCARASGLATAYDLAHISPKLGRQLLGGVRGEQLVRELNGQSCFPLAREGTAPKSIARTRTFDKDINQPHILEAAVATFAAQTAFRLRLSSQLTRRASLFLTTNKHKPPYRSWRSEVRFATPTADTGLLISSLVATLGNMYESGVPYHRAGVVLHDLVPADRLQTDLLGSVDLDAHNRAAVLMSTIDQLNARHGMSKLHYAAEDLSTAWQPKRNHRSPRYTSNWNELPPVRGIY